MTIEAIVIELLTVTGVTSLLGHPMALAELPQGTNTYPTIVWEPVTSHPIDPINAQGGGQLMSARIQVTVLAQTMASLITVREAIRAAMEFKSGTIAGLRVVSVLLEFIGPYQADVEARMFEQSTDYMVTYYSS